MEFAFIATIALALERNELLDRNSYYREILEKAQSYIKQHGLIPLPESDRSATAEENYVFLYEDRLPDQ